MTKTDVAFASVVIGLVVVVLIVVAFGLSSEGTFKRECSEAGGHIYAPSLSSWCLDDTGRIIEVYP